jgi:hypothetical protein
MRRNARVGVILSSAVVALAAATGTAAASEYSAEVTINPGKTFTAPSHDYYLLEACPVADFEVSVMPAAYLYNAQGNGNADNPIYPCVAATGPTFDAAFTVYNPDDVHTRTFEVFGWY